MAMLCCNIVVNAQIISQFTFDNDPVTAADVGPDATSISSSAFSDAGGVGGTNGLNAGLPKLNINMVVPTDASFDTPGIDVSFDYHREESAGTFWERGNSLRIVGCANLSVSYRVDDGGGGFNTVNSGNVYAIPNDDTYRNYRFYYTDCDGVGVLTVDGVIVWSNDGPDNRSMYWTGSGDITVGNGVDATGSNQTFFDNLVVGGIGCSPLPVELISFNANLNEQDRTVDISWSTASEVNSDYFIVQRSQNGDNWHDLFTVDAAGNSSVKLDYFQIDKAPLLEESYYRLKQVDLDSEFEFSPAVRINNKVETDLYPNPVQVGSQVLITSNQFKNESLLVQLFNTQGALVFEKWTETSVDKSLAFDIPGNLAQGAYILKSEYFCKKLMVK